MRWVLALQSFVFRVEHINGKDNVGDTFLVEFLYNNLIALFTLLLDRQLLIYLYLLKYCFLPLSKLNFYCLYCQ